MFAHREECRACRAAEGLGLLLNYPDICSPSAERLSKCALSRGAPQRHGSKMRSRIPLLLAVLAAACLRFGSAEVRATLNALIKLSFLPWS